VFSRKGLEEGSPYVPLQSVEPPAIHGVCVVLHVAAKFLPVPVDDIEIGIVSEFGPSDRLASPGVSADLFLDDRWRDSQLDPTIAVAMVVLGFDFVAEEPGLPVKCAPGIGPVR
jgi:hypothetical protein